MKVVEIIDAQPQINSEVVAVVVEDGVMHHYPVVRSHYNRSENKLLLFVDNRGKSDSES